MTFDEFVGMLKECSEEGEWWVEHARFKGDQLVKAEVHFEFKVKGDENEEAQKPF